MNTNVQQNQNTSKSTCKLIALHPKRKPQASLLSIMVEHHLGHIEILTNALLHFTKYLPTDERLLADSVAEQLRGRVFDLKKEVV